MATEQTMLEEGDLSSRTKTRRAIRRLQRRAEVIEEALRAAGLLPLRATAPASSSSSAQWDGRAQKPWAWSSEMPAARTGSPRDDLEQCLTAGISAFFNLHPSTSLLTELRWTDGQTLQVTCSWHIGSGSTKDGDPGAAAPNVCSCPDSWTAHVVGDRAARGWWHHESCALNEAAPEPEGLRP